jgi:signal transduction histidine kinase
VSVRDDGIGIPLAEQGKIFEKFYRVSTGMVHDVKGTGLGLSLVKHIAEAHRGTVTVHSRPGQGSTFTIRLPIRGSVESVLDASPSRANDDSGTPGYPSTASQFRS